MSYAELLCISNFTFQRGASHARELIYRAKALGYTAIALVDECTLASVVRAHEAALEAQIQLIIGASFRFPQGDRLALLAPSHEAYSQLCELITHGRRRSRKGQYQLTRPDFVSAAPSAIGLWVAGPVIEATSLEWFSSLTLAERYLAFTHDLAHDSARRLQTLRELGKQHSVPLVAAGDAYYHVRERRRLHDVMTAIRLKTTVDNIGKKGPANGEHHLRPLATLRKLYPTDLLERTVEIASRCTFSLKELRYQYPEELVPAGLTATQHLRNLTEEGIKRRWPNGVSEAIRTQIERELVLIRELKYEHFFLTVAEIVAFARARGILCQGRGSAANSSVCYALHITEVDPGRVSMLFERFVSKERHEPPDIDVDFEHQRREEVIQHIYEKYGRHRAAIAATLVTYRHRRAIRDVAKALGFAADVIDALAKSIHWFDGGGQISSELSKLGFNPESRDARLLLELVGQLLRSPRHLSQHVGGFVISQAPLSSLVPIENAAMGHRTVIQWDKDDLETLGLLKVDVLALGMLSAIRRALALKSQFDGKPFGIADIPAEDPKTYDMICAANTVGVFQIESRAQMSMLPRLKPREYYDLVIEIALIRPGPIQGGMVHPYLRRRQGLEPVTYPNKELEAILKRTCGVPLFQEQVMALSMVAAGFNGGEADQVRRSMATWERRGGLQQFRDKLINGMLARGYKTEFAESIYQQILGFGSYGFAESHSASFALLAYASSWLKCHASAAFVAGLLNAWPMGFYAPAQLVADARRNGVSFRPIDVQSSCWDCTLERGETGQPEVRIGLRLVSGLSEEQGLGIERARQTGLFSSVDDLAHRAHLPRRALAFLAQTGALESVAGHRRQAHWSAIGIENLPGMLEGSSARESRIALPVPTEGQDILADYASLGFTLGRHPVALLRKKLNAKRVYLAQELRGIKSGLTVRVGGVVTHRQRPETASGVVFISLEDESGIANLIVWPSVQTHQREAVFGAQLLIVEGELQSEMNIIHVIAKKVRDCSHWLGDLKTESRDFH